MRILIKLLIGLAIIVGLLAAIGLLLPSSFTLDRSTTIDAPAKVVFDQVNDIKKWEAWSPWAAADPSMKTTYGEKTVGLGASSSWTSDEMGNGSMTFSESVANKSIKNNLDFGPQGTAVGNWKFDEADGKTNVTWGFSTDLGMNPIGRYMGKFMMEGMIAPQFEQGLESLKNVAEEENKRLIKVQQLQIEAEKRAQAVQDSINAATGS